MAIQLNDRDQLIFSLIEEHQVLLEKHIATFISGDDKPVLIRDRLRKLFYLDYLLCHRHGTKLPWWTTPTKPLVYMLSPLTRAISGFADSEVDLFDANIQRHLLEVANVRMLHLEDMRAGHMSNFEWTTCKKSADGTKHLDAKIKFTAGKKHNFGIINQAEKDSIVANVEAALRSEGVENVMLISRDEDHQKTLQAAVANSTIAKHCFFVTHHELYKQGVVSSSWQKADRTVASLFETAAVNFAPTLAIA